MLVAVPLIDEFPPMPRRPRLVLAGIPMHITQRGVNRAATFVDDEDRVGYRELLAEVMDFHGLPVHAYALMGNHVHLLITPHDSSGLGQAMRLLNQRYVGGFNRRHGRTGTLWEGRFRSCLVSRDRYLLTLYRYIDLNPVRAAVVASAEEYPWSSARANLGLVIESFLTPHETYLALHEDGAARGRAYREWLDEDLDEDEISRIRAQMQQERALGDPRFQAMVAKTLNRPVTVRPRGRPCRISEATELSSPGRDSNG